MTKKNSFSLTNGVDGSAISYTITYTDTKSELICKSTTIPTSSCQEETCTHYFDVTSSNCQSSSNITLTVFATNILGNGPSTKPLIITLSLSKLMNIGFDIDIDN